MPQTMDSSTGEHGRGYRRTQAGVYRNKYQESCSIIYRIFFCYDEGQIVILFNGFQKKTQKTPNKEINKALKLRACLNFPPKEFYSASFEIVFGLFSRCRSSRSTGSKGRIL